MFSVVLIDSCEYSLCEVFLWLLQTTSVLSSFKQQFTSHDSEDGGHVQGLARQFFSSSRSGAGQQGCLQCVQLVAGRPHSRLALQLDCLERLIALLTPSSCGCPAGVQMLYKSCSAPGVSISKGQRTYLTRHL